MTVLQTPMMKCGHAANSVNRKTGDPVCVICIGIDPGADVIASTPDLTGRTAKCGYNNPGTSCNATAPSDPHLAFFGYRPEKEFDEYYCGCRGWD